MVPPIDFLLVEQLIALFHGMKYVINKNRGIY